MIRIEVLPKLNKDDVERLEDFTTKTKAVIAKYSTDLLQGVVVPSNQAVVTAILSTIPQTYGVNSVGDLLQTVFDLDDSHCVFDCVYLINHPTFYPDNMRELPNNTVVIALEKSMPLFDQFKLLWCLGAVQRWETLLSTHDVKEPVYSAHYCQPIPVEEQDTQQIHVQRSRTGE
jgi:hypothetical protein